jgi:hypothetical protein
VYKRQVKGIFHVTVNKNGSADFNYKIAFPASFINLMSQMKDNPIDQVKKEVEKGGYEVVPYRSGSLMGIEARKHIDNVLEMGNESLMDSMKTSGQSSVPNSNNDVEKDQGKTTANIQSNKNPQVIIEEGILFDTYRLKGNVDLSALTIPESVKKYVGASGDQLTKQFYDQMDFRFLLTLPIHAKESNASRVIGEKGKTYEWELIPGKNNNLMISAVLPNVRNWLYLLGGVVGLLLLMYINKKFKKKKIIGR